MLIDPILDGESGLDVRTKLNQLIDQHLSKEDDVDTDGTFAANSDAKVPSQKAAKTYIDNLFSAVNGMQYKGAIDCSTNPNYPAADAGHVYSISVAGKIGGASGVDMEAGEVILCILDGSAAGNQATVGANWIKLQLNLNGALTAADIGSTIQAYSAKLAALDSASWANNKMIVITGVNTISLFDSTAYGRGFLNVADEAAARTYIDVSGGGGVDAYTKTESDALYFRLDNVDVDDALTADSDSKVPSQQAVKAYVDGLQSAVDAAKQDKDATLTAIAAMTTTANHVLYWTGVDTIDSFATTSYMRGLMNTADEAALKAAVNLEIGVDVQAYSADLSTYAGGTVSGRTINMASNTVSNIALAMFAAGVIDIDGTLAANSDAKLATQKAIKTYVDAIIEAANALQFKGTINASANPNYPAANAGHMYLISAAGKIGGASGMTVEVGDAIICAVDSTAAGDQATVGANWGILQFNLSGALTTANIGVTVQAFSSLLQAFHVLGTSPNSIPYYDGSSTLTFLSISDFMKGLLDDVDGTAAQTTLGISASSSITDAIAMQMAMQF